MTPLKPLQTVRTALAEYPVCELQEMALWWSEIDTPLRIFARTAAVVPGLGAQATRLAGMLDNLSRCDADMFRAIASLDTSDATVVENSA